MQVYKNPIVSQQVEFQIREIKYSCGKLLQRRNNKNDSQEK